MKLELKLAVAQIALLSLIAVLMLLLVFIGPPAKLTPLEISSNVNTLVNNIRSYRSHIATRIVELKDIHDSLPGDDLKKANADKIAEFETELDGVDKDLEALFKISRTVSWSVFNRPPRDTVPPK